jgi:tetratricopeptide (TPR) repeat protein
VRLAAVFVMSALFGLAQAPALDEAARLKLLRGYERRGEWFLAAEQLEALRKLSPKNPEYAYQLGVVYRSMSKWAFETMREQAPHSARVQQIMGEQYSIAGDSAKAIAAFEQAIAADPKLPGSHLALGVLYMRMNKKDDALAEIDNELVIAPDNAMAKQMKQALAGGGR